MSSSHIIPFYWLWSSLQAPALHSTSERTSSQFWTNSLMDFPIPSTFIHLCVSSILAHETPSHTNSPKISTLLQYELLIYRKNIEPFTKPIFYCTDGSKEREILNCNHRVRFTFFIPTTFLPSWTLYFYIRRRIRGHFPMFSQSLSPSRYSHAHSLTIFDMLRLVHS